MSNLVIDNIKIESFNNSLKVTNNTNKNIKVDFVNMEKNYAPYVTRLSPKMWALTDYNNWQEKYKTKNIHISILHDNLSFVKYNTEQDSFYIYKKIIDFRNLNPPVIIHGVVGGGTSIISKLLRYFGLFLGDDSGIFENRKTHESFFFRFINKYINKIKDDDYNKFKDVLFNSPNEIYFGDKLLEKNTPWGFKYFVENTHHFLSDAFKDCKFISIIKSPKNSINKTPQGLIFKDMNEFDVMKKQFLKIEGNRIFHIDYYKFFEDYNYVNKVLKFCNLNYKIKNQKEFEDILDIIKYEKNTPNKKEKKK